VNARLNYFMLFYFRLCRWAATRAAQFKKIKNMRYLSVQVGAENFLPLLFQKSMMNQKSERKQKAKQDNKIKQKPAKTQARQKKNIKSAPFLVIH
jgi:hypothetical protein